MFTIMKLSSLQKLCVNSFLYKIDSRRNRASDFKCTSLLKCYNVQELAL